MKSGKNGDIFAFLLLLNFFVQINGNKENQRKIQSVLTNNFIELNFDSEFQTDTCWYSRIRDNISEVSVNDEPITNFPGSFTISGRKSAKIYFNSSLNDLSYFLSYNEELPEEDIPAECRITEHFKNHIVLIDVEALDVSEVTTMANMFKGYNKLTTILFFQKETSILTNTKGMFSGCSSLTQFDFLSYFFKTDSVSDMSYMFSGCTSMEAIDLSNFDISAVKNMEYMFSKCTSLTSIDLKFKNAPLLENVQHMFDSCLSLESITPPYIDNPSLINMDSMFLNCISLSSIDFYNFNTFNVENMNSVFKNCSSLKDLDLSSFSTTNVLSMNSIFSDCTSLIELIIPNFMMQQLMGNNDVFKNVNNLRYIDIKNMKYNNDEEYNENTCINHDCNLPLNYNNEKPLIVCQNNKFISNEKIIEVCCYFDIENDKCDSYNYIKLYFNKDIQYENGFINEYRNGIIFINYNDIMVVSNAELNILANTPLEIHFNDDIISMEKFFSSEVDNNMANVISIDFSNFGANSIENMANMFYGCISLEDLYLTSLVTYSVENMDFMFYNCTSLKFLDISNFILSSTTTTNQMFFGLESLNFINLYYLEDEGQISSSELNTMQKNFYICQTKDIITNPKALNCCDYFFDETLCPNFIEGTGDINDINITKEIEDLYNDIIENIAAQNFKIIKSDFYNLQFSKYQAQLKNSLLSSVNLGECEAKLKQQEGLTDTDQFLMIKLDLINTTINATYVQYDIFNPYTYHKVSLNICQNISVKIVVPLILNESTRSLILNLKDEGYNIFDIKDDFYNDICSPYTAQNGADIVLSSRKTLIYDSMKNIYFCQKGCEFINYDTETN